MLGLEVEKLQEKLSKSLNWNASRIEFLSQFLLALYKVRTVNLAEIGRAFSGRSLAESKFRRIQRFLSDFDLPFEDSAQLIGAWLPPGPWILTMDRTDWKFGKTVINLLVLGVVYQGTAIPLFWIPLNKKGNSNTAERKELLSIFLRVFGSEKINYLTADREFVGEEWLKWLLEQRIGICLRIKKDTQILNNQGKSVQIKSQFRQLGVKKRLSNVVIWGCTVHVEGKRLKGDEYLIVLSNKPFGIIKAYNQRWNIETLFAQLKTRGFRFEDTHLNKPERISKLLALLALAFCYALQIGVWLISQGKNITFKKTLGRPLKSIFRHGLDYLRELLFNPIPNLHSFMRLPPFLSCT